MKTWHRWCFLVVMVFWNGCSVNSPGSEGAAREHFNSEFRKWMSGQENKVSTMQSRLRTLKEPISYDIRSVLADEPDFLACEDTEKLPQDWRDWPAYRFNVAIEWKSTKGTPLTDVTTYTLTWNTSEQRWYINERF